MYHLAHLDDDDNPHDQRTMSDLHLASAINLDQIEYLATGSFTDYSIYIPRFLRTQWLDLMRVTRCKEQPEVGLLKVTQMMLTTESPQAIISQKIYKKLVDLLGRALKNRGSSSPLIHYYEVIQNYNVVCNRDYMMFFRFLIQLVCMVSEASRGGRKSVYGGITIHDGKIAVGKYSYSNMEFTFYSNDSICFVKDNLNGTFYVGSFDSLLLMMDTFGQRLCLDIGNQICTITEVPGSCNREVLNSIIQIGDELLIQYGNQGYEFIGMFEALVVSSLLKKNPDPITSSCRFYDSCLSELREMVSDGIFDEDVLELFAHLSSCLTEISNESLSNIFCMYRIWGHPRVNILAGMEKVMTKGLAEKEPPSYVAEIIVCQFRKMFMTSFYHRNHKYPPHQIVDDEDDSYSVRCIRSGLPISHTHYEYSVFDFRNVRIEKLWEMYETYDVCHILNDKAVSPTRTELYRSIAQGEGTVHGVQRRGIVRWLMGNSIRCKEFLAYIDEYGLDEDSLIIGMYEKERELKVKARMFSLMSEQMRMYFVLTEELMANKLLTYFPEITMTDPLHLQTKKLWNISGDSHERSLEPVINIDFEKWNLNMREELTLPLFLQMDQMFGYNNLIARTHEIFNNSYIYSSSGKYVPPIKDGHLIPDPPMCYIGHKGGFEGLRQKGWTIATVCLLSFIADKKKLSVDLLGQGDNQVVRIKMPDALWANTNKSWDEKVKSAKEMLEDYMTAMDTYFDEAGLPIKIRETWTSTRLYMYGKYMFLDGISLPQWIKKLLRSYALSNEGTLTVSGVIGTIATNLCAAAMVSERPDSLYVVFLILGEWSLEYLLAYHPFTRKEIKEGKKISFRIPNKSGGEKHDSRPINRKRLIATILMVPTAVGGSITIPYTGFIIRGFPDNASEGYAWLNLLRSVHSEFKGLFDNWYTFLCNDTAEYDMLVQSPWAINHKKPPTPGLQSREVVRDWLLSGQFSQNSFLSNVSKAMEGFDRKAVCKLLVPENVNPLIANEMYNSFTPVYLDNILRRVENTRTIRKFALKMASRKPIVSNLMDIEHEFIGYLYWRGFQHGELFSDCATKQCRIARNIGWGRNIKGLTTPHPLEFIHNRVCTHLNDNCDGSDYIYCRVDRKGNFPPYLGSRVRTKVSSMQDIALRDEPLVSTCAKLLRYAEWLNLGPNAMNVVRKNIKVVCDISIFQHVDEIDTTFYAGCVEHRYNPACASEGCFINYAPQLGKRVFMSSDNMPTYGRGNTNYTLHFQAMYSYIQYLASHVSDTSFVHYHLCCEDCIVPVDDEVDDVGDFSDMMSKLYSESKVRLLRDSLGYLDKRIQTHEDIVEPNLVTFLTIDPNDMDSDKLRLGIHHSLALRCAMMLMYVKDGHVDLVGGEDLQAFPRIYCYKVSTETIINLTVEFLFLIKLARSELRPSVVGYHNVRSKLQSQILKLPLDRFKGVSSLCLGRTWNPDSSELPPFLNLGEYPEDTTSFINAVRSDITDRVGAFIDILSDNRRYQSPSVGMSDKEGLYILMHKLIKSENCLVCIDSLWESMKEKTEIVDCPHNHIMKSRDKINLVPIPMDTAMKTMKITVSKRDPYAVVGCLSSDILSTISIEYETYQHGRLEASKNIEQYTSMIRRNFRVLLPTSTVYKWDHMISQLSGESYDHIVVIADGTGQTSHVCCHRFPSAKIYPSSKMEKSKFIPQDMMSIMPFISRGYSNVYPILLETVPDDVTDYLWDSAFNAFLDKLKGKILIISDLEGSNGNWAILQNVITAVSRRSPKEDLDFIHKVYFHQSNRFPTGLYGYTNPFCNGNYAEGFLSNRRFGGKKMSVVHAFSTSQWKEFSSRAVLLRSIQSKESDYPELIRISESISKHCASRNFLTITPQTFLRKGSSILYDHMSYLSENFKAPYVVRLNDDHRTFFDSSLIRAVKGLKMLLIAIFGVGISEAEFFKNIHLSQVSKEYRIAKVSHLSMVIVNGDKDHALSRKELRASRQLRWMYLDQWPESINYPIPNSITDLYVKYIIKSVPKRRLD